jgi:hypothetical protein
MNIFLKLHHWENFYEPLGSKYEPKGAKFTYAPLVNQRFIFQL